MSMPLKSNLARSCTFSTLSSPNEVCRPTERDEASATTSSTGKFRSAKICSISRPTLPVAPTTATLYPMAGGDRRRGWVWQLSSATLGTTEGLFCARARGLDDGQPEVAVLTQELERVRGRA